MTREILSSALDMIDERYIASVTNKKMHPIGQKSLYTYKIVKPSAWRNLLDVAAVLILVVGVTVGFILMRQSIGPGPTPGDSLTDTETTETTSAPDTTETEPDTTDTEPIETEPAPEPVTISGVTYELRDGGYVVTGVTSPDASRAVLVDKIEEINVIGIADGAFDSVADPLNFRIFGYEDTFAREYAVENGHIFIEYYNGKLPDHYYPEGVKLGEWTENPETFFDDHTIYIARDDNERIDELVEEYLLRGTGYEELSERVLHRYACADTLRYDDLACPYYISSSDSPGDWDRYVVYLFNEENCDVTYYHMSKYGELTAFDEFIANAKLLFSEECITDTVLGTNSAYPSRFNVEGYLFERDGGLGIPPYCNFSYELIICKEKIEIHAKYQKAYGGIPGDTDTTVCVFQRYENGWAFTDYSGCDGIAYHLYQLCLQNNTEK